MTVKEPEPMRTLKNKQSKRFRPSATESFVIVKPPPTVSAHHPLNLQVQYIPPAALEPSRRRTSSSSSDRSSSGTSNGSSSRGGKIVPLYNLHSRHSHSLLANSIHDAGTDDKVAKFHKNGIEIVNVGIFTPIEVWSSSDSEDVPSATRTPNFLDTQVQPHNHNDSANEMPQPRRLLGKLFQGRHTLAVAAAEPPSASYTPDLHPEYTLPAILGTNPVLMSKTLPPVGRAIAHTWICKKWSKDSTDTWFSQTLNLSPTFEKCGVDIRVEWARGHKRDGEPPSRKGSLANLRADPDSDIPPVPSLPPSALSSALFSATLPPSASAMSSISAASNADEPRPSMSLAPPPSPGLFGRRKKLDKSGGGSKRCSDVEDDSDPEDSEVPWVCTFVIRQAIPTTPTRPTTPNKQSPATTPLKHSRPLGKSTESLSDGLASGLGLILGSGSGPNSSRPSMSISDTPLRMKVASLAPAPHHPKVVAQLKTQYPLPDVDLREAVFIQREPEEQPGLHAPPPEGRYILTAEEIKDIICTTAMWLVVREGFSGLSKKVKS